MHICMLLLAKYGEKNQPVTGVDLQAITQIRALKEAGHRVTVLAKKRSLDSKVHELVDGIEVYRVGPSGLYWLWTALILWRLRHDLDVVHILGQRLTTYVSIFLCRLFAIPTVLKIPITHNRFTWKQFHKALILKLENLISRQASAYIAISAEIADQLAEQGFYPERIERLPNGVDMERFRAAPDKDALRDQLGLPLAKKIVLYSGRLISRKGYDLVLAAWPEIHAACPEAHLVVAGGGTDKSIAALERLDAELGGGTVTYVGGVSDPAPYLAASDLYLFPSRREGLPNALLEAMACRCACVASAIGGCVDLITPDKTGLLFPAGDAAAMASAAIRLLRGEALARTVGEGAQALIAAEYEIHAVAERLAVLYRSLQADADLSYDFATPARVLAKGKRILLLAPHQDDEALMGAGIIAHALDNGADLKVVVVTNGDNKGRKTGLVRSRETIAAMASLGLSAANIIFLGYGNIKQGNERFLSLLYNAAADDTLVASRAGTETYSIPEAPEYHYRKHGVHAPHNRAAFRQDLEAVIEEFDPDHIFAPSLYDTHPDHSALYRFTVESVLAVKRRNPGFSPVLHEYLIHAQDGDDHWPARNRRNSPLAPFSRPATLAADTLLDWEKREVFTVPLAMQSVSRSRNKKYVAIGKYRSQRPAGNNNYLYSYVKRDEFFWAKDFANIAFLAEVSVSSENAATGQAGQKAADGLIDGYPRFPAHEWVTMGEAAGAWIRLSWPEPRTVDRIVLYGRPHPVDTVTGATLAFSDGGSLQTGALPADGSAREIHFAPRTVEWVQLTVDAADGENTGLSEFEVYEAAEGKA
ncbi:MAG TPA: glycosyltransferase [Selenomonadales bacterium]|nr:glycosyltransferase [Selenomonadales bacterium]